MVVNTKNTYVGICTATPTHASRGRIATKTSKKHKPLVALLLEAQASRSIREASLWEQDCTVKVRE